MSGKFDNYNDNELYKLMAKKKSDAELAFGELYSRYNQRIYAYCLRVTGSHEDANDIFQEVFVKFYASANEKHPIDKVAGFLMTIARNLCLNYNRDKKEYTDIESLVLHSNDEGIESKELMELITRTLEFLDFQHREVFVMRMIQGFSYDEIAEITNTKMTVVKNQVYRAKEKIKEILQPIVKDLEKIDFN